MAQSEPRTIKVVAKRFGFEPSRIEVTEGEQVRLVVTSADGVHGLEIQKFNVNQRIPRGGDPVTIEFVASAAGEFPIGAGGEILDRLDSLDREGFDHLGCQALEVQ